MKHLSRRFRRRRPRTGRRSRATSTTSRCARWRDPADRYHSAGRWTPTSSGSRGIGVSAETAGRRRRRCLAHGRRRGATTIASRGAGVRRTRPAALLRVRRAAAARDPGRGSSARSSSLALVGGWFALRSLESQLDASQAGRRPRRRRERRAPRCPADQGPRGLKELVERRSNDGVNPGIVFEQDPQAGDRIERGNFVTIVVSTGPSKVRVPTLVGAAETRPSPS